MPSNRALWITGGVLVLGAAWLWYRQETSSELPGPVPEPSPRSRPPIPLPLSPELWQGIQDVAGRLDMDPRHLAAVIAFESRFNPSAVNPYSGATGLIQFMPQCLTTDTQALTPSGWKFPSQLRVGDEIITYNAETGQLETDRILNLFVGQAPQVVRMFNKQFDFVATPDHRWYCHYQTAGGRTPARVEVRTTEQLSRARSRHKIIRAAPHKPSHGVDTPEAVCELVGVIAGDGSITRTTPAGMDKPGVTIYQSQSANPSICDYVDNLLRAAGIVAPRSSPAESGMVRWSITGDRARFLLQFFDAATHLKVLEKSWLFQLSPRQLLALRRGYIETDGSIAGGKYESFNQTEVSVMEDFQLISLLLGQVCNVRLDRRAGEVVMPSGTKTRVQDRYYTNVKIRSPHTEARSNRMNYEVLPGPAEVWCPTTRNQTWVAKRGGFVTITGNTAANLGTTTAALGRMSALEQLPYVERYFAGFGGPFDTLQQVALTVFYPAYRNKPSTTVFPENVQAVNPGIRTPADYVAKVVKAAERVLPPEEVARPEPQIEVVEAKAPPPIPETMPTTPLSSLAPPGVLAAQQRVYSYARSFLTPTSQGASIPHIHRTI